MKTNRRKGNDYRGGDNSRFSSNQSNSTRNRSDQNHSHGQGYSNTDAERYPVSRAYDEYDDDHYNSSNYGRGGEHRDWDSQGYSQFDRSNNNDFRSRNQRYGSSSGMYGSDSDDYRSQNRRANYGSGAFGLDAYSDYTSSHHPHHHSHDDNHHHSNRSTMGGQSGFGAYDVDHEERDHRNQNRYNNSGIMGEHRGKGPKGYKRSDERIKEDINDRLSDDHNLDASEIEVEVKNGEVTLSGSVSERSDKRRAEDVAEMISGVNNVENRIRISKNGSNSDSTAAHSGREGSGKITGGKNSEKNKMHEPAA